MESSDSVVECYNGQSECSQNLMSSVFVKRVLLKPIFRVQNSQKSFGAWSGVYGGWVMTEMFSSVRNCCTMSDV
jgi:hypothetical protein